MMTKLSASETHTQSSPTRVPYTQLPLKVYNQRVYVSFAIWQSVLWQVADVTWPSCYTDLLCIDIVTVVWTQVTRSHLHTRALFLQWMYLHSAGSIQISLRLSISNRALSFKFRLCPVHRTEPNRAWLSLRVRVQLRWWRSASPTLSVWPLCPDNKQQSGPMCGWRQGTFGDWDDCFVLHLTHKNKSEGKTDALLRRKRENMNAPTAPPNGGRLRYIFTFTCGESTNMFSAYISFAKYKAFYKTVSNWSWKVH